MVSGCVYETVRERESIWLGRLSKADCPWQCGGHDADPRSTEQDKGRGGFFLELGDLPSPGHQIPTLTSSNLLCSLHHWLPQLSLTGHRLKPHHWLSWAPSLKMTYCELLGLHQCLRQPFIIKFFLYLAVSNWFYFLESLTNTEGNKSQANKSNEGLS